MIQPSVRDRPERQAEESHRGRIVVGVDGSAPAANALAWAIEEARRRDARLEVVHAWQPDAVGAPVISATDQRTGERRAAEVLSRSLAGIQQAWRRQPIISWSVCGRPGQALVDVAAGADLVVVGSHRRGRIRAALLGSVSRHVVDHAPCPVVVVPPR